MKTINGLVEAGEEIIRIFLQPFLSHTTELNFTKYRYGYTQIRIWAIPVRICSLAIITLVAVTHTQAQSTRLGPFNLQLRSENPLREPIHFTSRPTPVSIDQDKDGDLDVVIADFYGGNGFDLLRNDGTNTKAAYNYAMYYDNPYNYLVFGNGGTPAFSDMDKDGDLDMLLGLMDGTFRYYRNNSTKTNAFTLQSGTWNSVTKAGNPLNGIDLGDYASPTFFDFDNDGDDDLIIGTSFLPNYKSVHYYINDGEGNFTVSSLQGINPNLEETTPAIMDVDGDGGFDIIIGARDGNIYYFKRTDATSFTEQTGSNNPFNGVNKGLHSSPTTGDFDHDGDADLVFGAESLTQDLYYFENKGNSVFTEKLNFDNPFGGVTIIRDASPYFIDLDKDNRKDIVIAGWYGSQKMKYLKNVNGDYVEVTDNPLAALSFPNLFVPSFVDLDGDGDIDLIGGAALTNGESIHYYKNDNGSFVKQSFATGPFSAIDIDEGKTDFIDIDGDGDLDLFIGTGTFDGYTETHFIRFFKNTGTSQTPVFTELTGLENPLSQVLEEFTVYPRFSDIDNDGDFDAIIGEGGDVIEMQGGKEFSYYENIGTSKDPKFIYRGDLIPEADRPFNPAPSFVDQDNDGDLDIFVGGSSGDLSYYKNVNPAAVATVNNAPLNINLGSPATYIDHELTITDADNDSLVFASVTINNYVAGRQTLTFAPQPGISGSFNTTTGVLSFNGKAPLNDYQVLLRSVAFEYKESSPSGRVRTSNSVTIANTLTITVLDSDGTTSLPVSRTMNIVSGQPPVITDQSVSIPANGSGTVDLLPLITDADNDVDLTTLSIVSQPSSGASASIDKNSVLNLGYANVNFAGTETISVKVCDQNGACDQNTISITVTNNAPVFSNGDISLVFGKSASVDLTSLVSDVEKNIDWSTLAVKIQPLSGANATIDSNSKLIIDYNGKSFVGTEALTLRICDKLGACDDALMTVTVTNSAPVLNSASLTISYGGQTTLDLLPMISDNESNVNLSSLEIIQKPASGAVVSINSNHEFSINYKDIVFAGDEVIKIKVCDAANACAESTINVSVSNAPPVIVSETSSTKQGSVKTLNLLSITSDPDGNLEPSTLEVVESPLSGALATIEHLSATEVNLVLNYSGINFRGSDQLKIKVCDLAGACTENILTILVEEKSPVEIFNAVAPNSPGDNKYMRILNLPTDNKVIILNRWGDVVFSMNGYDHEIPGKRFEGFSSSGNTLTSGTYFYKVEFNDNEQKLKTLTGYLTLKQ